MSGVAADTIEQFRRFVERARNLTVASPPSKPAPISAFRAFVARARPLATGHARAYLERFIPRAALLRPWLVSCDLLAVAGLAFAEDPYTELIAWALDPQRGEALSLAVQQAWLSVLGVPARLERPLHVRTQLQTDDGIPDLVLHAPSMVVVVEAKTGSAEHVTPTSKRMQTEAYLGAARRALSMSPSARGWTVFLTPDRRPPASDEAVATSYVELALALAAGLSGQTLVEDARAAYAMLITHLVTCAVPAGVDVARAAWEAQAWMADDNLLVLKLEALQALGRVLPLEDKS